ncbi:uncharacterized protein V1518DRAFT_413204 [Limtongia smithiae]|uniref:uncharacterized protein n=1 Tax=Limtongia smithiae TaxID=1125753 RepID=UPI0034CDA93B
MASGVSDLPAECLLQIFAYLSPDSLARAACVCRSWHDAAFDPTLWSVFDLTRMTPRHLASMTAASSLVRQFRTSATAVVLRNPFYLCGSDIAGLLRHLGSAHASSAPPLKTFCLENYSRTPDSALVAFFAQLHPDSHINTLSFHGTHVAPAVFTSLCYAPALAKSLVSLDLSFSGLQDGAVYMLADTFTNLTRLSLAGNLAIGTSAMSYLMNALVVADKIQILDLRFLWAVVPANVLALVCARPSIQILDLRGCDRVTKSDVRNLQRITPRSCIYSTAILEEESVWGYTRFVEMLTNATTTTISSTALTPSIATSPLSPFSAAYFNANPTDVGSDEDDFDDLDNFVSDDSEYGSTPASSTTTTPSTSPSKLFTPSFPDTPPSTRSSPSHPFSSISHSTPSYTADDDADDDLDIVTSSYIPFGSMW